MQSIKYLFSPDFLLWIFCAVFKMLTLSNGIMIFKRILSSMSDTARIEDEHTYSRKSHLIHILKLKFKTIRKTIDKPQKRKSL